VAKELRDRFLKIFSGSAEVTQLGERANRPQFMFLELQKSPQTGGGRSRIECLRHFELTEKVRDPGGCVTSVSSDGAGGRSALRAGEESPRQAAPKVLERMAKSHRHSSRPRGREKIRQKSCMIGRRGGHRQIRGWGDDETSNSGRGRGGHGDRVAAGHGWRKAGH